MAPARPVGSAFFPLDEQLGLLAAGVTPRAEETLVRLASWMPFEAVSRPTYFWLFQLFGEANVRFFRNILEYAF